MPVKLSGWKPLPPNDSELGWEGRREELPRTSSPHCGIWLKTGVSEPQREKPHTHPEVKVKKQRQQRLRLGVRSHRRAGPSGRGGQGEAQNQDPGMGGRSGLLP